MTEYKIQDSYFAHLCRHFSKDNAVGWIDPEGAIHTTALHGHLEFLIDGSAAEVPGLEECLLYPAREFRDRQTEEWSELYSRGERRWHEFDPIAFIPEWEQERDAYDAIYSAGWGRIGSTGFWRSSAMRGSRRPCWRPRGRWPR